MDDRPASVAVAGSGSGSGSTASALFSLANNAEHLDRLEASEQVTDIASFQDIDLPPPEEENAASGHIHYGINGNRDGDGLDDDVAVVGVRRAKRFYYCLPMMQQYKFAILACLSIVVLVIVATSLTAASARNAKQMLIAQQMVHAHNPTIIINDAPPSPSSSSSSSTTTTAAENHDEEVGDVIESNETDDGASQPPRETPFPTTAFHYEQHSKKPSPSSSSSTSSLGSNSSPSSSSSIDDSNNKPKWFTTNHEQYKSILMSHQSYGAKIHSHSIARLFCQELTMTLCSYEEYCPDGIGKSPYEGPHDGSHLGWDVSQAEQWAPYMMTLNNDDESSSSSNSNADERIDWVQVGTVPEYEDGTYDNGYGRCYSYVAWSNNDNNGGMMDIEDAIRTAHRRWILCCSSSSSST